MNDIEWRNLQQQVLKNKKDILKILQSLGAALPDPIPGPQGPQGERGLTGEDGDRGSGWIGLGSEVPSNSLGKNGDFFLRSNGMVYHKFQNTWQPQFTIKGANGLPGCNVPVEANPEAAASANLTKISINGIVYTFTLEDYYTEGDGIEINQDEISVAIGEGLKFDEYFKVAIDFDEVQEHLEPGNGIKIENGVISFDSDSEPGVFSVNGKSGAVDLKASDIMADNGKTIQETFDDFVEDNIEGSATVVVDLNEAGTKYQVRLDNDYKNKIDKALQTPSSAPTEKVLVGIDTGRSQIQVKLTDGIMWNGSTSPFTASVDYSKVQKKLNAGANINIDPVTNTISATAPSGGVKFYKHSVNVSSYDFIFITTSPVPFTFDFTSGIGYEGVVVSCLIHLSRSGDYYWSTGIPVDEGGHNPAYQNQITAIKYINTNNSISNVNVTNSGTDVVTQL